MTRGLSRAMIVAGLQVMLVACGIPTETTRTFQLRFEGTVTADNKPLEGARVDFEATFFVWTVPTSSATTDAGGKYVIQGQWNCDEGADLNSSPGNAAMLVASSSGYEMVSSVNIGRTLICTEDVQRVDFVLRRAVTPGGIGSSRLTQD